MMAGFILYDGWLHSLQWLASFFTRVGFILYDGWLHSLRWLASFFTMVGFILYHNFITSFPVIIFFYSGGETHHCKPRIDKCQRIL